MAIILALICFHHKCSQLQPAANDADPVTLKCKSFAPPRDHDTTNNKQQVRKPEDLEGV